jgi:hypothetical protein
VRNVQYCTQPGNWLTMPRIGFSGKAYPMAAKLSDQAIATRDLAKRQGGSPGLSPQPMMPPGCFATLTTLRPKQ